MAAKPWKRMRRLLVVFVLVALVVTKVWVASLPPKNTARATVSVLMNGVPQNGLTINLPPQTGGEWLFGTTNLEGKAELKYRRKAYDALTAIRGILSSPFSSAQWKRFPEDNALKETPFVPIGKYFVHPVLSGNKHEITLDSVGLTIEISPDADKNDFVFELADYPQQ